MIIQSSKLLFFLYYLKIGIYKILVSHLFNSKQETIVRRSFLPST